MGQGQPITEPPAPAPGFRGTQDFLLRTLIGKKDLKYFIINGKIDPVLSSPLTDIGFNSSLPRKSGKGRVVPSHFYRGLSTQGSEPWPLDPDWQKEVEDGRQSASPPMQHPNFSHMPRYIIRKVIKILRTNEAEILT